MSNFTLKQDGFTSYTAVSNCFIEQFMPCAAGEFVKIYIYLLKCLSENKPELSISKIADAFNNTEKDVVRALKYWQKKGLLKLTFDKDEALSSLCVISPEAREHVVSVTDAPVPGQPGINVKHTGQKEKKEYTKDQLADFSEQEEIRQLFYIIQKYLGQPLKGQETNTILYLYDELKFPAELIEYLFEYCISKGHKSIRYIEKTALAWADEGIRTVNAAKLMSDIYSDDCHKVLNVFGISGRKPSKSESDYVSKWTISYGFDTKVILEACERTVNQVHQPNFEYADAILRNWKSAGVTSLDDVKKLDEVFEKAAARKARKQSHDISDAAVNSSFNDFAQRDYNYSLLERKLMMKNG